MWELPRFKPESNNLTITTSLFILGKRNWSIRTQVTVTVIIPLPNSFFSELSNHLVTAFSSALVLAFHNLPPLLQFFTFYYFLELPSSYFSSYIKASIFDFPPSLLPRSSSPTPPTTTKTTSVVFTLTTSSRLPSFLPPSL